MAEVSSPAEVWWRSRRRAPGEVNLGRGERIVSAVLGAALLYGARNDKTPARALLQMAAGTMLLLRSASGHSWTYDRVGVSSAGLGEGAGIDAQAQVTVNRPREEVFDFFRNFRNFAYMKHVRSILETPDGKLHWEVTGPRGMPLDWDAEFIAHDRPDRFAWRSLPGSYIEQSGSVHFEDGGGKGTVVILKLRYVPPQGAAGFAVGKALSGVTNMQVAEDLRRMKRVIETGSDITTKGQTRGPSKQDLDQREREQKARERDEMMAEETLRERAEEDARLEDEELVPVGAESQAGPRPMEPPLFGPEAGPGSWLE